MPHHATSAILAAKIAMALDEGRDFRLDRLGQQLARTKAQNRRQGIIRK